MIIQQLSFLIVEDVRFQREMAVKLLGALGSPSVLSAANGQAALELLASLDQPIDIIISDLDMPEMDGIEFIRYAAEQNFCRAVAIASGMDQKIIHIVENIVEQYDIDVLPKVNKPITANKIAILLENYLTKSKKRHPERFSNVFSKNELQEALDLHQFQTWYQPKVSLKNGLWMSVEALSRWKHPSQGWILPSDFIPLLEKNALINQLTWQQLHTLFNQFHTRCQQETAFTLSVNVSPVMLEDTQLPDKLLELVSYYGLQTHQVILEITENLALNQSYSLLSVIARLKLKGFLLSIDDFGTGYANLQQLETIPFSELKLDRSFVHQMTHESTKQAIVSSNITLAQKLNLNTVAEGVETYGEWQLLQQLECDMAQGFFIAASMPYDLLTEWHLAWKKKYRNFDDSLLIQ